MSSIVNIENITPLIYHIRRLLSGVEMGRLAGFRYREIVKRLRSLGFVFV
jgi:hypothetical protein